MLDAYLHFCTHAMVAIEETGIQARVFALDVGGLGAIGCICYFFH